MLAILGWKTQLLYQIITVEATFLRTERQLSREPEWKSAYTVHVHDMVDRKAAIKLSKGPNLFIRSKWHTTQRNVTVGDIVWLSDQNALRGQFKLGRVVSTNPDHKGIVRDVNVRIFPSYSIPMTKVLKGKVKNSTQAKERIQATIVHRDVRRLVVLLPVEDQMDSDASGNQVQT